MSADTPATRSAMEAPCFDECSALLRELLQRQGVDAHITTIPPLIVGAYEDFGMECPHNVRWFLEPTGEQRAQWAKDGAA